MKKEHVCICIPTYKRPFLLNRLLKSVSEQNINDNITFSVVVIDNDRTGSAKQIVNNYKIRGLDISYNVEPVKNIAIARNRAIKMSKGQYVVFIDDDEFPEKKWLLLLYNAIKKYDADGVLGPVKPFFEDGTPKWLIKSGICTRPSYFTGKLLNAAQTRTGNVIFDRKIFIEKGLFFDPSFGLSGGEDTDFFRRAIKCGLKFVWCQEASVFENVPPERWTRKFYMKRAYLRGRVNHFAFREKGKLIKTAILIKSFLAFSAYSISIPLIFPLGDRVRMKLFDRYFHHVGRLATAVGINVLDRR